MRILDGNGRELTLVTVDHDRGRLVTERLLVARHEAVEAVAEQGHWEIAAEYPNGGKDVRWGVDVPATQAAEAWEEYEEILRYAAYTPEELSALEAARTEEQRRAERLEALLESGVLREELDDAVTQLLRRQLPTVWRELEGE